MLAYDDTDVISGLPRLADLSELPDGVLAEIVRELIDKDSTDDAEAPFQNRI